jgi:UDP-glucuronate 4-epimerase
MVTGGAGFIGSHLCERLIDGGHEIVVDALRQYYDPAFKHRNLKAPQQRTGFHLI